MKLLIVEDNSETIELIKLTLKELDFEFLVAKTAEKALEIAEEFFPNIIILDLELEGDISGDEVCKEIKDKSEKYKNPFIIIVSSTYSQDIINKNLMNGSDDYIVKPFDFEELYWRVNNFKKLSKIRNIENEALTYKNITVQKDISQVFIDDKKIFLGKYEYLLLVYLLENKGKIKSKAQILDAVWENNFDVSEHTVNQCLKRLKKKINFLEECLINRRGMGYGLI